MRKEFGSFTEAVGVWDQKGAYNHQEDQLATVENYAGTLLHETTHAISGKGDVNRDFEKNLTQIIGIIASNALKGDL